MRLLSIDHVRPDMQLARNIYSADGKVLLASGISLTDSYIARLHQLGISSLYIKDSFDGPQEVTVDELVKIQTRIDASKLTRDLMNNIRDGKTWNGQQIRQTVNNLMEELIVNRAVLYNLIDIRAMNDYTFAHSLTVCILSLMTGIAAGYNYPRLKDLGTGAILHDIGKALVPETILNKAAKLTPEEFTVVQEHAQLGYNLLSKRDDISSVSAHVAWEHHEKFDGSGYPRGLKGTSIHEFARIVSVADVYDALSTDRVYRKRLLPHEAIEYIRDTGRAAFDPEFGKIFLESIAPFPIGSMVQLNSGEIAVVQRVPKDFPARPLVKVITSPDGTLLDKPYDKDLQRELSAFIVKALKDEEVKL